MSSSSSSSCSGFASITPKQDSSFQYYSNILPQNESAQPSFEATPEPVAAPKPKKFFKSRNSVPDAEQIVAIETQIAATSTTLIDDQATAAFHSQPHATQDKIHTKSSKKQSKKGESTKKVRTPKPPKVQPELAAKPEKLPKKKKKPKTDEKPVKQIEQKKPTRVLSRTRKNVDYAERSSRSPSPTSKLRIQSAAAPSSSAFPQCPQMPTFSGDAPQPFDQQHDQHGVASSPSKSMAGDHPPIVLRISKVSCEHKQRQKVNLQLIRADIDSGQLQCKRSKIKMKHSPPNVLDARACVVRVWLYYKCQHWQRLTKII